MQKLKDNFKSWLCGNHNLSVYLLFTCQKFKPNINPKISSLWDLLQEHHKSCAEYFKMMLKMAFDVIT